MLISFGLLHLNNSFHKSPGRNTGCCATSFPRNLFKHFTVHILKNHCHGNFLQWTTFQTYLYFFGRDLWSHDPPNLHFQLTYCMYWKQTLISSSKEAESDGDQPPPAKAKLFQVVWSNFHVGWPIQTRTLTGARNFNMLEPLATILPLSLYLNSSELPI